MAVAAPWLRAHKPRHVRTVAPRALQWQDGVKFFHVITGLLALHIKGALEPIMIVVEAHGGDWRKVSDSGGRAQQRRRALD